MGTPSHIHGYFSMDVPSQPIWALYERNPSTKRLRTWMSLTPMEIESHMPHVAAATGHVVVAGLGMGMYLWNLVNKPDVTYVDVLERDLRILSLFEQSTFKKWPKALRRKVGIHQSDAMVWTTSDPVDYLYADIWPLLGDTLALPETRIMQKNIAAKRVGYWTQEMDFASFAMERGIKIPTMEDYTEFVASTGLPLIGAEWPTYPRLAMAAFMIQGNAKFRQGGNAGDGLFATLSGQHIQRLLNF